MSMDQALYLQEVNAMVKEMVPSDQEQVWECKRKLEEVMLEYGGCGDIALSICGLERALESENLGFNKGN